MFKCVTCRSPASHETWRTVNGQIINNALWCGKDLIGYFKFLETLDLERPEVHRCQEDNYRPSSPSP